MLKQILCIILPASLCLNPMAMAAESPDEQIARTHAIAKKAGDEIFYRYLIAILQQTSPWQFGLARVDKEREKWLASGDKIRAAVENLSAYHDSASSLMKSEQRMWEEMAEALDSYVENYERAIFDSRQLVRDLDSAAIFVRNAKEMVRLSLADINDVCDKGIAQNIQTSHMVPVKLHNPKFGFYFHVGTSTEKPGQDLNGGLGPNSAQDQDQQQQQQGYGLSLFPIADRIFGDAGPTMNAVLSYGTPIGTYVALTGFKLSALSTAGASTSAVLAAGGITIAIAVVLLAVTEALNRAEARKLQDDVERVFWDRASSNEVIGYVKAACRPVRDKLSEVPVLVERLKSARPGSP